MNQSPFPHGNLQRVDDAQAPAYDAVLDELYVGRKASQWMWLVFPKLRGLGHSPVAMRRRAWDWNQDEVKAHLQRQWQRVGCSG